MNKNSNGAGTALYRKYRPKSFTDVVGQDHVVSVLEAAIKDGQLAHSYLFSGSRGTGKTSVARILAQELGTSANDLIEIDAASNNGVDDVRELREAVRSLPFDSKYKVYILDEVHMLSKGAFNALLKTIEEPPAHVIFILATTELEKVPETIVSRCQTFVFKKPTETVLKKVVTDLAKREGYTLEAGSAELIALLGDGSFRDAEGILQKVLTFSKAKKISVEEVEKVTGAPSQSLVEDFIRAIAEGKLDFGLSRIKAASDANIDMQIYLKLILNLFRTLLLIRVAPAQEKEILKSLSESEQAFVKEMLKANSGMILSKHLVTLLESYQALRYSFIKTLPLELALIKILGKEER